MRFKAKPKWQRRKPAPAPPIVEPPPEIAAAIDRISADDREWFEAHPGVDERIRPAGPHEFWPHFDSATVKYVIVHQVWPGYRLKLPIIRVHRPQTERVQ